MSVREMSGDRVHILKMLIAEVGLDSNGSLFVRPQDSDEDFTFIYRTASGVRWNKDVRALVAYEPERWDPVELFKQIAAAVESEYGISLRLAPSTAWTNVPAELSAKLEESIGWTD